MWDWEQTEDEQVLGPLGFTVSRLTQDFVTGRADSFKAVTAKGWDKAHVSRVNMQLWIYTATVHNCGWFHRPRSTASSTFCKLPMLLIQSVMRLLFLAGFSTLATSPAAVFAPACMADNVRAKNRQHQTVP